MVFRKPGARSSWKVRSLIPGGLIVMLSLILGSAANPAVSRLSSGTASPPALTITGDVETPQTAGFGPSRQSSGNDAMVNSLLFDNLVRVASDENTILPDLAARWTVSKNARNYTFFLRQGVKWSDGKPFTAKDVVFTITRACQWGTGAYIGYQPTLWRQVSGAAGIVGTNNPLSGIKAIGPYTVRIHLSAPNSWWLRSLTDAVYAIVPQHILQSATAKTIFSVPFTTTKPVGTGPYRLAAAVPNQYYEFTANPTYFGGKPKISKIFFKLNVTDSSAIAQLKSGELQLATNLNPNDDSILQQTSSIKSKFFATPGAQYLYFRTDDPTVASATVRQAIFYAIDRRSMLAHLANGAGKVLWTMPGFDQTPKALNRYPYDPAKAKQLLAQANFNFNAPFVISYCPECDPLYPQLGPAIQANLQAVGINVKLNPLSVAAWIDAILSPNPSFEMTFNGGGAFGLSPDRSSAAFNCRHPAPLSFYSNCALDALYFKARGIADPTARDKIYSQIALLENQQLPQPALWQIDGLHAWSPKLGGTFALYSNARDSLFGIVGWTVK